MDFNEDDENVHKFVIDPNDLPPEAREALYKFLEETEAGDNPHFREVSSEQDIPPELKAALDRAAAMAAAKGDVLREGSPDETFDLARAYRPGETQNAIQVGDLALTFTTPTLKDSAGDPILLQVLDASEHADEFPDWEERFKLNDYVLCQATAPVDEAGVQQNYMGWFARINLLPITQEQAAEVSEWLKSGEKPDSVAWLVKTLRQCLREIDTVNDNFLPDPKRCEKCGSDAVVADVMQIKRGQFFYGFSEKIPGHAAYSRTFQDEGLFLFARCFDCDHVEDLRESGMGISHINTSTFDV